MEKEGREADEGRGDKELDTMKEEKQEEENKEDKNEEDQDR